MTGKFPEIGCSYVSPDQCVGFTPANCCERINSVVDDKANDDRNNDDNDDDNDDRDVIEGGGGAGVVAMTSMTLLLVFSALAAVL